MLAISLICFLEASLRCAIDTARGKVNSVSWRSRSFKASSCRPNINWSRVNSFLTAGIHPYLSYSHKSIFSFNLVKYASIDSSSSWRKVQSPYCSSRTFVCGEQNLSNACKTLSNLHLSSEVAQGRVLYTSHASCPACDNIIPIFTTSLFSVDSVPARNHCNCSLKSR